MNNWWKFDFKVKMSAFLLNKFTQMYNKKAAKAGAFDLQFQIFKAQYDFHTEKADQNFKKSLQVPSWRDRVEKICRSTCWAASVRSRHSEIWFSRFSNLRKKCTKLDFSHCSQRNRITGKIINYILYHKVTKPVSSYFRSKK